MHFLREGTAQISLQEKRNLKKTECIGIDNGTSVSEESICMFDLLALFDKNKWRYKRFQATYFAFGNGK